MMENLEEREDYGVSKPEQFTWKQLLDGYACTECGRCNTVCPATITDKPLFPKEIILGVKEALFVQSNQILGEDTLWNRLGVAGVKADETAVANLKDALMSGAAEAARGLVIIAVEDRILGRLAARPQRSRTTRIPHAVR